MGQIKVAVQGASTLPMDVLEPFQGDLKRLERAEYERMRNSFIEFGISFTTHIWTNPEGHHKILDGHQTRFTLSKMRDEEGWDVPEIPVSFVQADSYEQARRKLLAGASQYGKVTEQGLLNFLRESDIPYIEVAANFNFPEIKMESLLEKMGEMPNIETLPEANPGDTPDMRSAGADVKQLQLYFSVEAHAEFMSKVSDLSKKIGKDNVTDTLMELVREAHARIEGSRGELG